MTTTDPHVILNNSAMTRGVRRALFWDEDGDWGGAADLGLLRQVPGDYSYERTPLGEQVAAAYVQHMLTTLAHHKDGDDLRNLLLMLPCKYEDAAFIGLHVFIETLVDFDLIYRGERPIAAGSALIHTWLSHEVVVAICGPDHGRAIARRYCRVAEETCAALGLGRGPTKPAEPTHDDFQTCGARKGAWACELEAGHVEKGDRVHACPDDDLSSVHEWTDDPPTGTVLQAGQGVRATGDEERPPGWYWGRWNGGHAPAGKWEPIYTGSLAAADVETEWGPRIAPPDEHDSNETFDEAVIRLGHRYSGRKEGCWIQPWVNSQPRVVWLINEVRRLEKLLADARTIDRTYPEHYQGAFDYPWIRQEIQRLSSGGRCSLRTDLLLQIVKDAEISPARRTNTSPTEFLVTRCGDRVKTFCLGNESNLSADQARSLATAMLAIADNIDDGK